MSNQAVYAIAISEGHAYRIVDHLTESGFCTDDIAVVFPDKESTEEFSDENDTMMPEGVMTGAAGGGVVGGTFGLLVGIGALAIPGVGALIAAGPLLSTFSGMAAGATVGGIAGGLIGLGLPEFEAQAYEQKISEGKIVIAVIADTTADANRAQNVMSKDGAQDISVTSINQAELAISA